jgi:branched-chain amino acid transport system substrate-binding protein
MKKKVYIPIIVIIVLTIVGIFAAQYFGKKEPKVCTIGAILNLTGPIAAADETKKNAISLAVDIINKEGGINGKPLKVEFYDSKLQPKEALSIMREIELRGTKVLLVSTSQIALTIIPVINKNKIIMFATSAHPELLTNSDFTFRAFTKSEDEGTLIAKYFLQNKFKIVGILHTSEVYGQSVVEAIKNMVSNQVTLLVEEYKPGEKDFRDILIKMKAKDIEAIGIVGFGVSYSAILKQLEELKLYIPIVGNVNFSIVDLDALPQNQVKNLIFLTPHYELEEGKGAFEFFAEYQRRFQSRPPYHAVYIADAAKIVAEAFRQVGCTNIDRVHGRLTSGINIQAFSGRLSLSPSREMEYKLDLVRYKEGKILPIEE